MLGYRSAVRERAPSTVPPGSPRVGDYRLLTKIGEGGMGVVHLAEAPDGSRVALKVLRPHIVGDDEARERLAREVSSLRRVKSPRIAEIINADPWGETPFVATRYVPGLSLHEHIRQQGPIVGDDLRWFAAGLAEAVIAVHIVGVLHRDIKPSNVLLEGRAPVLIDFGLARLAEDPRLTVTGWLLGTPGYLAPEILYGDDATTASDVHSWAATVVFAATGHPPFGRGPAMAIMDRVRRGEHDLSAVPADLLPMITACLSPDPAHRPETTAMLADLRRAEPSLGTSSSETSGKSVNDSPTMPFVLFATEDDSTEVLRSPDATEVFGSNGPTMAQTPVEPNHLPPPTRAMTIPAPVAPPPLPLREPARAPYMAPPPPQRQAQWQPPPAGPARLQRKALLAGGFVLVSVTFALAPYLALIALTLAVLGLRTYSWTTESARDRMHRRGRPRWYDAALTVLTSPWYLFVAMGGTLLLVLSSAVLALVVGLAHLLFARPAVSGLLLMGAVLAFSLWWGPGSRRLRAPTRQALLAATRWAWLGWLNVALLAVVVTLCAYTLSTSGVNWAPQPGPPWRPGTILGSVVGFLTG